MLGCRVLSVTYIYKLAIHCNIDLLLQRREPARKLTQKRAVIMEQVRPVTYDIKNPSALCMNTLSFCFRLFLNWWSSCVTLMPDAKITRS